jgi:phosphoglycolate phosphatase-like HAD superfamily hydrolase
MKTNYLKSGIDRRTLVSGLAALPVLSGSLLDRAQAQPQAPAAQDDPLPSWKDRPAKQAILDFVRDTTDQANPKFVPVDERIATFDQDGTLWVEQPLYTQVVYCFDRVPAVVADKPELKAREPFRTVLSGDREAIAKLSLDDLEAILSATLTGMSVDDFEAEASKWLASAKHPRWNRLYTDLAYQPMLELLHYLRDNAYKTYIVTGGGQDFVRTYAQRIYGIPPEQVVGTMGGTKFGYDKNGVSDQGAEAAFERRPRRQAGRHSSDDRPASLRGVRQLHRRPANARIYRRRRRSAADDAGAARRCRTRIRLRSGARTSQQQGRHVSAAAVRRGENERLDCDQHEERLDANFRF